MLTNTRWKIGILMFLGIVINYMDRVNKKDLEETKERLEDIEKAINSILK